MATVLALLLGRGLLSRPRNQTPDGALGLVGLSALSDSALTKKCKKNSDCSSNKVCVSKKCVECKNDNQCNKGYK